MNGRFLWDQCKYKCRFKSPAHIGDYFKKKHKPFFLGSRFLDNRCITLNGMSLLGFHISSGF